jgi:hypothetical protein
MGGGLPSKDFGGAESRSGAVHPRSKKKAAEVMFSGSTSKIASV